MELLVKRAAARQLVDPALGSQRHSFRSTICTWKRIARHLLSWIMTRFRQGYGSGEALIPLSTSLTFAKLNVDVTWYRTRLVKFPFSSTISAVNLIMSVCDSPFE